MALTLRRNKSTRLTKDELDDNFVHLSNYENLTNKPTLLQGAQGPAGLQGPQGVTGTQGAIGPAGPKGDKGDTGDQGLPGADGIQGPKGDTGEQGIQGPAGNDGAVGVQGPAGPAGADGAQGPAGNDGAVGAQGPKGDTGEQGIQGPKGDTGDTGATGATGPAGATGAQGPDGAQGPKGDTGPAGSVAAENITGTTLASGITASSLTSVGTLSSLAVSDVTLLGGYSQVAGYYSELGVKYSGAGTQHGMTLQPTNDNTTAINFLNAAGTNIGSVTQTASTVKFVGDGSQLSNVAKQTTGTWTVTPGTNTYSFTLDINAAYNIWVRGNIANGIITYIATISITNSNVPVIGTQYAWNYTGAGNPILLTSIPNQVVGTAGTISTATVATTTSNRFDFGISNTTGSNQTVYWGYTKIST